jgi:tRNA modification GTPase
MSCLTHQGLEELREALYRAATSGLEVTGSSGVTANIRHRDVLRRSADLLSKAVGTLEAGLALDAAAGDMRLALEALGEITGETATEDILDAVFSNFCIGK